METAISRPVRRGRPRRQPVEDIQEAAPIAPRVEAQSQAAPAVARPPLRPEVREEDPREAAARRAAEIMGNIREIEAETDKFYIPLGEIPDGWDYNWKRKTIYNQEDPAYQVALSRTGWEPVPAQRHPTMMPVGWKGGTIERDGMILMQRPKEISDRMKMRDDRLARDQVRAKEAQLAAAPPGSMEREYSDPRTKPKISKSFEAIPIPKDG